MKSSIVFASSSLSKYILFGGSSLFLEASVDLLLGSVAKKWCCKERIRVDKDDTRRFLCLGRLLLAEDGGDRWAWEEEWWEYGRNKIVYVNVWWGWVAHGNILWNLIELCWFGVYWML